MIADCLVMLVFGACGLCGWLDLSCVMDLFWDLFVVMVFSIGLGCLLWVALPIMGFIMLYVTLGVEVGCCLVIVSYLVLRVFCCAVGCGCVYE